MMGLGLETWRSIALYGIAIGQTLFVLLYLTFPWYKSFLGRALFYKAFILAVLLDLALFARLNPTMFDWDAIFTVLYFLLGIGIWYQFSAFLRIRIAAHREARGDRMSLLGHEDEYDRKHNGRSGEPR